MAWCLWARWASLPKDEECPSRVRVVAGYPTPLRVFPRLLVVVGAHRWAPLVQADEGVSPAGGGGEALPGWVPGGGGWQAACPWGSLPTPCWFCQDGLASRWDSPGLPCAAGTSLLDSLSVSRLGVGEPQAWVAFAGWEVVRHAVAGPVQSGVVVHLPQLSVGSPWGGQQGLWLCPAESSRERLVHAVLSRPEGPFWSLYKILLRLGILRVLQGSSLVCRLLLLCLSPAGGGVILQVLGNSRPLLLKSCLCPLLSPLSSWGAGSASH